MMLPRGNSRNTISIIKIVIFSLFDLCAAGPEQTLHSMVVTASALEPRPLLEGVRAESFLT